MIPSAPWTGAASRRLLWLANEGDDIPKAVGIVARRFLDGVSYPPTDLEALGSKLGILRLEAEPLPISGELRREPGGFVVVYSTFLGAMRRRFTIAHEMAHAIFETAGPDCPRSGQELERLCDMLASELLIPGDDFLSRCGEREDLTWQKILDLSALFRVSHSAICLRCAQALGVTIFEVDRGEITRGFGSIRKGSAAKLDAAIQSFIDDTRRGEARDDLLYVRTETAGLQWWKVQGRRKGQDGRAMVLMIPLGQRLTNPRCIESKRNRSA